MEDPSNKKQKNADCQTGVPSDIDVIHCQEPHIEPPTSVLSLSFSKKYSGCGWSHVNVNKSDPNGG